MRKTPYTAKIGWVALFSAVGALSASGAVLDVTNSDTTVWKGVMNSAGTGYLTDIGGAASTVVGVNDQQTGQTVSDLVGNSTTAPTIFIGYGTISGVDYVGFRVRLNTFSTLDALKQVTYIGIDFNKDAVPDLYAGYDVKTQVPGNGTPANYWNIVLSKTDTTTTVSGGGLKYTNTSPSTSGIIYDGTAATALYSQGAGGTDLYSNYRQADTSIGIVSSSFSLTGGDADAFLTFAVPYASFVSAANSVGFSGFTTSSTFRVTANTSNTEQLLNQDYMDAASNAFSFSSDISLVTPVPEPATYLIFGTLMAPVAAVVARRRWQKRPSAKLQS